MTHPGGYVPIPGWDFLVTVNQGPAMKTTVVNLKTTPNFDVYIGRTRSAGGWGNKYATKPSTIPGTVLVRTVGEAISRYEADIRSDPEKVARVKRELKGKVLGCWCKPGPCHGDVLARIADED